MDGHGEKLTRKQESAIAALLQCGSIEEAAKRAKVGVTTLRRWLKIESFDSAYLAARREVLSSSINKLCQASSAAVDVLEEVAKDKTAKDSARVSAAKSILDLSIRAVELEELAEKLKKMEELAHAVERTSRTP